VRQVGPGESEPRSREEDRRSRPRTSKKERLKVGWGAKSGPRAQVLGSWERGLRSPRLKGTNPFEWSCGNVKDEGSLEKAKKKGSKRVKCEGVRSHLAPGESMGKRKRENWVMIRKCEEREGALEAGLVLSE